MELEKQPACVAEYRTVFIAPPQRRGYREAIFADRVVIAGVGIRAHIRIRIANLRLRL